MMIASRILAAVVGGYAFSWLFAAAFAVVLHDVWTMPRVDAVLTATMFSFPLYAAVVIAVFATRSVGRAWLLLACGTFGLAGLLILL